jgi:hypothetical protein
MFRVFSEKPLNRGDKAMKLLLKSQHDQLLHNGRINSERSLEGEETLDFQPVVKFFTPDAGCTWLLSELDPDDPDIAFGLCDLGMGYPELGSVRLSELEQIRGPLGLPIERDRYFSADYSLSVYARAARHHDAITENSQSLQQAAAAEAS